MYALLTLQPMYVIHTLYVTVHENNITIFNVEVYQQFQYDKTG